MNIHKERYSKPDLWLPLTKAIKAALDYIINIFVSSNGEKKINHVM
jgi:hypothetical protein